MLVQKDIFWEDRAIESMEIIKKYFPQAKAISEEDLFLKIDKLEPQPFRGSLAMAKKMGLKFDHCNAMRFIPALAIHSLNAHAKFLPLSFIPPYFKYETEHEMFIRPCSPFKEFAGNVYTKKSFSAEMEVARQRGINPHIMCVMSHPYTIDTEWRCIFVDRQLIDCSQYMVNGELNVKQGAPEDVIEKAELIAKDSHFDNIFDFVIDIGLANKKLWLIEVNAFQTASFYAADRDAIYAALAASFHD